MLIQKLKYPTKSNIFYIDFFGHIDITPLHLACLNGKGKIVELLLNNSSIAINSVAIF